jgi:hypothetical protein
VARIVQPEESIGLFAHQLFTAHKSKSFSEGL